MGVHWISYRRKSELQRFSKIRAGHGRHRRGMRSRLSSFASQPELPKAVTQRLAELESTLGCTPTPDPKTRPRSPTPGENQPGTGPAGASTSMEATTVRRLKHSRTQTSVCKTSPGQTTGNTAGTRLTICSPMASRRIRRPATIHRACGGHGCRISVGHPAAIVARHRRVTNRASRRLVPSQRITRTTWEEFKKEFLDFFLPPRYFQRLEDEIRARTQRVGEPFTTYLLSLRVMMRRAAYSMDQELDRLYDNLLPEYQLFTRRHEFTR
ncbi:hypothetical protein ACLKA6_008586 [Drosophila palustris]